jgi:hypothetical protein
MEDDCFVSSSLKKVIMKKFNKVSWGFLFAVCSLFSTELQAQVTGTKSIPGDYATLQDAITDLNTNGVGAGGAIINIGAPQSAPTGGYQIGSATLNASTNAANPLVINGGTHLITPQTGTGAGTATALPDAVFIVAGTDYLTLNQLNIAENPANINITQQMECGILVRSLNNDDACQNLSITNCTINLNGTGTMSTTAGIVECGISVQTVPFATAISPISTTATAPTSAGGVPTNITISGNTIQNCYNGIAVIGNSAVAANNTTNVMIGGNTPSEGNTISNIGAKAPECNNTVVASGSGIFVANLNGTQILRNTITVASVFNATYGIQSAAEVGNRVIRHNLVQGSSIATTAQLFYAIFNTSAPLNVNVDSNIVQNITLAGTGQFYGVYNNGTANATGSGTTNNNLVTGITRTGANGNTFGMFVSTLSNAGGREIKNNVISNFTNTTSGTGATNIYGLYVANTQASVSTGNAISNLSVGGTGTGATIIYGLYTNVATNTHILDSNRISNLAINHTPTSGSIVYGIFSTNASGTVTHSRNNISTLSINGTVATASSVEGINLTGSALDRTVVNNFISGLSAPAISLDNVIKGINVTAGVNNKIYNNTIYLGGSGALTSTGANFGVSGITWNGTNVATTTNIDLRNNIIHINVTTTGNAISAALRNTNAGVLNTIPQTYNSNSNNNIFYAPNVTKTHFYAESAVGSGIVSNFFNLTNDPNFNTACGVFKTAVSPRESGSFTENNLVLGSAAATFIPSGVSFAESGGQVIAAVTNDYDGIPRGSAFDMGALEFSGTSVDATAPTITYALLANTLCLTNPSISATITDLSGINTTAGNVPRLWFKKSTENDVLPASNTSADNGWKFVEASNTSSPFNFTMNYSLLNSAIAAGDVIQYFVVAQDLSLGVNVAKSSVNFASGFCPTSVALSSSAFPVTAPNSFTINTPPATIVATTTPGDFCVGGAPTLSTSDNSIISGLEYQWQSSPTGQNVWTNVPLGNTLTFVAPTINVTTDYRLVVSCLGTPFDTSAVVTTIVNTPTIASVAGSTICGPNITSVSATPDPGYYIRWFANAVGGAVLATGNTYNTPLLFGATTYYAAPAAGATVSGGRLNNTATGSASNALNRGIVFTTTAALPIDSLGFRCTGPATTLTVQLWNAAGTTQIGSNISVNIPANSGTSTVPVLVTVPTLINIPAAGTYRLVVSAFTPNVIALYSETSSVTGYPYAVGPNMSITGTIASLTGASSTTAYYNFYKVVSGRICEGLRVPVNVLYTVPPAVTLTASADSVCFSQTTSSTMTLTSPNDPNYNYVWSPATGLNTTTGATVISNPASAVTYTIVATDAGTGCASIFTKIIGVYPAFNITASISPTLVCPADSANLTVNVTPSGFVPSTYTWTPSGFSNPNIANPKVNSLVTKTFTVTATESHGCTRTATTTLSVHPLISGIPSASPNNFCEGTSISTITSSVDFTCFGTVNNFAGPYAPSNWTLQNSNLLVNGSVTVGSAPASISLVSGLNDVDSGSVGYSLVVGCGGNVSFNWNYALNNSAIPWTLRPRFKINGGPATIFSGFNIFGTAPQSGSQTITVNTGDLLTIELWSYLTDLTYPATLTLTNFVAPAAPLTGTISIWDAPTGGNNLGTPPLSVTPTSSNVYYAQYTQNITGCVNPIRVQVPLTVFPTPNVTASANPGNAVCIGNPVTLQGGGAVSYIWNGNPTTGSDTTLTPATAGLYTVVGTDANGCSASSSVSISLNPLPSIGASASPSNTVCDGSPITLQGSGGVNYIWNGNPTNGSDTTLTPAIAGTYTVVGVDANGCSNSASVNVNVNPLPSISIGANPSATVCNGSPVTLTASGASTYTWNGIPTSGSDTTLTPAVAGAYTVVGTDANGCSAATSISVGIFPAPNVNASLSTASTVCAGTSVTLQGSGAITYTWDGIPTSGSDTTITASNTAVYTVVGTDANSCTASSSVALNVNALPIINALPPTQTVCNTLTATIDATGAGPGGFYSVSGPQTISLGVPFSVSFGHAGIYTIIGTDGNSCSNTATSELIVSNALNVTATASPNGNRCFQNSVTITGGGASNYTFNGTPLSGTDTTFITFVGGTYTIVGSDALGCSNSTTVTVSVNALSGILALTSGNNSVSGTSNAVQVQPDGSSLNYTDANCDLIAVITDGFGGSTLGNTNATVNVDASIQLVGNQPYVRRWYAITPNNTNASALVKLYITQSDFDAYNVYATANGWPLLPTSGNNGDPNVPNIRVTKTDANGTVVYTPAMFWNGNVWEATLSIASFSEFRFHSANPGNAALPVMITTFSGQKMENSDLLSWSTSSENNNQYFEVQHSTNGMDFQTIAKVNSKAVNGNSQTALNYKAVHENPVPGHNYYRLTQVDIDGKINVHAKVLDIIWGNNGSTVSIYPNPAKDVLNIDLFATRTQNTSIKLMDMSGRLVKQIQLRSEAGMNQVKVDLRELAEGIYTVQVIANDELISVSKVHKN